MRKMNKKGFTIVELVIVIAVIAILAAVLIPTYSSLVKKANLSADQQAVKQMNTALSVYTAENGAPADYFEVKQGLGENDINTDSLTPVSKGYSFYWLKNDNKIVLLSEKDTVPADAVILNSTVSSNLEAAKVGDNMYNSLQDAINAAESGATITLQNDIKVDTSLNITKNITLDLNGHTIYNTDEIWDGSPEHNSLLLVSGTDVDVTIKGGTFRALVNDCYAIQVQDSANLTIEDGTFVGNITAAYLINGSITIKGGIFSIQQQSENKGKEYDYIVNRGDAGSGTITIEGGKFQNFDPRKSLCGNGEVVMGTNTTVTESKEVFGGVEYTYYVVTSNNG